MELKQPSNESNLPGFTAQMSFRDSYKTYELMGEYHSRLELVMPADVEPPDAECTCIKWGLKRVCMKWSPFDCNV